MLNQTAFLLDGLVFRLPCREIQYLIHHNCLILLPPLLRSAERSILFSETSVRLSDGARSAASSHAPKKGCGVREVWRSQTCTSGSPFFCLLFFGEAKKSKCPAGMKRMVNTTPSANHKAPSLFQAATMERRRFVAKCCSTRLC